MQPATNSDETCDICHDLSTMIMEESLMNHSASLGESKASASQAHSYVRFAGARKFLLEDPLEAAAAEKILK